ncbi:MAG: VOC family protein [Pseudomonadales bacterium]
MTTLTTIHHINFIVKDLNASVADYRRVLGLGEFLHEELIERGVSTARILLGGVWLVLVSPHSAHSIPGRYLKENGEGFFLLSFGVNDLKDALAEMATRGTVSNTNIARRGLSDWLVADLNTSASLGAYFHLTENAVD